MKSENSNKVLDMRTVSLDEASGLLRQIAGNRRSDESLKAVFRRLERKLSNWSDNRIRDVWHRDPRVRLRAEEVDQLRGLAEQRSAGAKEMNELEELRSTVARLAKYESLLQRIDAEMFGPEISATRDHIGQARGLLGKSGV
jgi:hypothetical protein